MDISHLDLITIIIIIIRIIKTNFIWNNYKGIMKCYKKKIEDYQIY